MFLIINKCLKPYLKYGFFVLNNKNTVTVLSKVIVEKELKQKKLFEIKLKNIEFKREFYLVYHKDKTKNLLFETFIEFIKNRLN